MSLMFIKIIIVTYVYDINVIKATAMYFYTFTLSHVFLRN